MYLLYIFWGFKYLLLIGYADIVYCALLNQISYSMFTDMHNKFWKFYSQGMFSIQDRSKTSNRTVRNNLGMMGTYM